MATIQQLHDAVVILKREVRAAWIKACEAEGIPVDSSFVVFGNTVEAALYNEEMGLYLKARRDYLRQTQRNKSRRDRHAAHTSCGLKRVKGGLGGVYYE